MKKQNIFPVAVLILLVVSLAGSYPVDGYEKTGIRRLFRLQKVIAGKLWGTPPASGGRLSIADIHLNLRNARGDSLQQLPAVNPKLQKRIDELFPNRDESYSLAVLEITPARPVRYAVRKPNQQLPPGSVGKLVVVAKLFEQLQKLYPENTEKRAELLRTRMVTADRWIHVDSHEVPVYDPATDAFKSRAVKEGDVFSLYEWVDHMLSASANSAASMVWKEVLLMQKFGPAYPPTPEAEQEFFTKTPKDTLRSMVMRVNDPLRANGITSDEWQLGSLFTNTGKKIVPGEGGSRATVIGYMKYLVALERGRIIDEWSSLEIKRLMYMTARRIRYAASPALEKAAVYFKSGSLYRCKPEPDFVCGKYMGNVENAMNSVAIVEHPDGRKYMVALTSNVLKKNSAVEHQSLATFIERILSK